MHNVDVPWWLLGWGWGALIHYLNMIPLVLVKLKVGNGASFQLPFTLGSTNSFNLSLRISRLHHSQRQMEERMPEINQRNRDRRKYKFERLCKNFAQNFRQLLCDVECSQVYVGSMHRSQNILILTVQY